MDQSPKLIPFSLLGEADPVPATAYVTEPKQAETLALLYELSHEITSILDRSELLRLIAERSRSWWTMTFFTVMLWNESTQVLESVFAMRFEDAIPSRMSIPLHQASPEARRRSAGPSV